MTKADLVSHVARNSTLTKTQAESAVNAVYDAIGAALVEEGGVTFSGLFGVKVIERRARDGRNPQTGKAIKIPARKALKVVLLSKLAATLNE